MRKILVTGANGFIGSNLVKRLVLQGYQVHSLVRKSSDLSFLKDVDTTLFYGNINEVDSLKDALKDVEKVYHVAGLAADWGAYELFEKVNFFGTQNLANAAHKAGVKKMVYISTVAFHGFGKVNMDETFPVDKYLIPYAQTKYLAEEWLWQFQNLTDMKITAVRPGNVFGINDRTFMLKYIDAMISGKFMEVGKGKSKTCPIFIDNLIDIILLVGEHDKANGEAFIATDGLDINWHTFNTKLADALGVKLPKASIPYVVGYAVAKVYYGTHKFLRFKSEPFLTPYRINNGGKDYHFSIDKLKSYFDYQPKVSLEEAIQKTVDWYRNK